MKNLELFLKNLGLVLKNFGLFLKNSGYFLTNLGSKHKSFLVKIKKTWVFDISGLHRQNKRASSSKHEDVVVKTRGHHRQHEGVVVNTRALSSTQSVDMRNFPQNAELSDLSSRCGTFRQHSGPFIDTWDLSSILLTF